MNANKLERVRGLKTAGEKIAMLTAYDYPTARLLDEAGVDLLLVGDSLGMVVLGYPDTTTVTMEEMLHHARAVARAHPRAAVVVDLPAGSYRTPEEAVANAHRLIDAGADAVKLEGGVAQVEKIAAVTAAGIPLMSHLGMLPQSIKLEGGYRRKGKTAAEAAQLLEDARAVEKAGAFAIVLELVQKEAAAAITAGVRIPTIGIGSGISCDGQVLVTHDLIGLFPWFVPKHTQPKAKIWQSIQHAAQEYVRETKSGSAEG